MSESIKTDYPVIQGMDFTSNIFLPEIEGVFSIDLFRPIPPRVESPYLGKRGNSAI
jgi:hypothetical protein